MHRLSSSFVLGFHGCDKQVGERLIAGEDFRHSDNAFDWLGPGIYFWENNPERGLEFAREQMMRKGSRIREPFVIGAAIDLGSCLDLATKVGIDLARIAHAVLVKEFRKSGLPLPVNSPDRMRRNLDCAVIKRAHRIAAESVGRIQTVKGVFLEGGPAYSGAGFEAKTHIQVAVSDASCIKGVFRVRNASS